ncbi:hypothetical protein B0H13DRAFT_1898174 [Mycena leptocephala]|nr:hypothetical protein B0H13DRAFT_1898174 [Mycena leptocephala]
MFGVATGIKYPRSRSGGEVTKFIAAKPRKDMAISCQKFGIISDEGNWVLHEMALKQRLREGRRLKKSVEYRKTSGISFPVARNLEPVEIEQTVKRGKDGSSKQEATSVAVQADLPPAFSAVSQLQLCECSGGAPKR